MPAGTQATAGSSFAPAGSSPACLCRRGGAGLRAATVASGGPTAGPDRVVARAVIGTCRAPSPPSSAPNDHCSTCCSGPPASRTRHATYVRAVAGTRARFSTPGRPPRASGCSMCARCWPVGALSTGSTCRTKLMMKDNHWRALGTSGGWPSLRRWSESRKRGATTARSKWRPPTASRWRATPGRPAPDR